MKMIGTEVKTIEEYLRSIEYSLPERDLEKTDPLSIGIGRIEL